MLQPFGMGNPQPVFLARGVSPVSEPRVMKEKHLRFMLRQPVAARAGVRPMATGTPLAVPAIFFNGVQRPLPTPPWDMAFQVEANEYRGETNFQVQVQALRSAARDGAVESGDFSFCHPERASPRAQSKDPRAVFLPSRRLSTDNRRR